jgi:flagellum-specific ATP synthase
MISASALLDKYTPVIASARTLQTVGHISQVVGLIIESNGPQAPVGEICIVRDRSGREVCRTEIVGFRDNRILSMVLGDVQNIAPGMEIIASGTMLSVHTGDALLGRVLDGLGQPMDGKPMPEGLHRRSVYAQPPNPLLRKRIHEPMATGVRAIDGLLTMGKGQRVGIFAGSGVGKSTLLGMIARNATADVNVIALIGERGREVREFIEKDLGPDGLSRSVVVVATSDMPALVRVKAPFVATAIAESFRDQGLDVMLMMDSVTRLAMAQREVGLSVGEPPTTKGYTPSVFAMMPRLMERAGSSDKGTITALYTVLVEGDDMNEPIADTARGILDGHIVLARRLAAQAHYPAIDVLESVSRVMGDVVSKQHKNSAQIFREMMAAYREAEDLINVGAYQKGANPVVDKSLEQRSAILGFLRQQVTDPTDFQNTVEKLLTF